MNFNFFFCIFFSLCFSVSWSQEDALVYFIDKLNVENALLNPYSILSERAVNRKASQNIPIDDRDVPVNENYISQLKQQSGIAVLAKSKWFNAVHVRGTENDINLLASLSFVSAIDFANKNLNDYNAKPFASKNQSKLVEASVSYNYGAAQNQTEMIAVNQLHINDYTGDGIYVAVLDAGFPAVNTMGAFHHSRNQNKLLGGYDFVDRTEDVYAFSGNAHGTMVLSTMAGFVENTYVGTAPDASYYLFRTEDVFSESPLEESLWVEAAERADSLGVDIINSSLGYTTFDNANYNYTPQDMNGTVAYISRGAGIAHEKGVLVVNSAGNSGASSWTIVGAPADHQDVFSIGAVDSNGDYAYFSSIGNNEVAFVKPDVVAKGLGAAIIDASNTVQNYNGTSFSGPIIAGAMACLKQALPTLTNDELKALVRSSASQYTIPDLFLGYGIPDFSMAYQLGNTLIERKPYSIGYNPKQRQIEIYPIPASRVSYTVFDTGGKLLIQHKLNSNENVIDLSSLSNGIYLIQIQESLSIQKLKFIIY